MHFNPVRLELQHVQLKACVLYLLIKYNNAYSVENCGLLFRIRQSVTYVMWNSQSAILMFVSE